MKSDTRNPTDSEFVAVITPAIELLEAHGMTTERAGVLMIGFGYKLLKSTGLTTEQMMEAVTTEWVRANNAGDA